MAKIEEDEPADTGGWINTFADLMNLLLCFFVLLFSMSTVDAQKYEAVVKSMSESINIFDGGGDSIGQGPFIDSGTDQVVAISQYFNEFESSGEDADATEEQEQMKPGESASEEGEHNDQGGQKSDDGQNKSDDDKNKDNEQGQQNQNQQEGSTPTPGEQDQNQDGKTQDPQEGGKQQDDQTGQQGQQTDQNPQSKNDDNKTGDNIDKATVQAVEAQQEAEQKAKNTEVYEEVMKAAEDKNVEDDITVQMDKKNQYVQITMNGALLFDSGKAMLRSSVKPILSKVGDILKSYKGNRIQILGHTDAVAIHSAEFPNNLWLSMARATSVFEYMTNVKKLEPGNMETTGRGEYDPIASNGTAAGRAKNRRVEFRIYTNK